MKSKIINALEMKFKIINAQEIKWKKSKHE